MPVKRKLSSFCTVCVVATLLVLLIFKFELLKHLYSTVISHNYQERTNRVSFCCPKFNINDFKFPVYNIANASRVSEGNRQVVPLSAYYDRRPLHSYKNSTVILASVLDEVLTLNHILGCEVDGIVRFKPMMTIRTIYINGWIQSHHPVSHTDVIVTCFDLSIHAKSAVSLIYLVEGICYRVTVENEVVMPTKTSEHNGVMVCGTLYGTPPYLDQWLQYQQTIGVTFIHLNVDVSFVKSVKESDYLRKLISSGYVKMVIWEPYLNTSQVFLYSQSLKYQDCILRYRHAYKYILIIDFDEYFIPLNIKKNISSYADHLFASDFIGSVSLPAVRYYCAASPTSAMPLDGNITMLYDTTQFTFDNVKSIHLLKAVEEASVHNALLIPPYRTSTYSIPNVARCYIAHITRRSSYENKCI